jgi:signal transduction histidine kinase
MARAPKVVPLARPGTPVAWGWIRPEPEDDSERRELALLRLRSRDEEARRIARDLHDEAGQLLVGVHLALDEMAQDLRPEARPRLRQLRDMLDRAQDELRRICHEMRPLVLDDLGLEAALHALAQGVAARSGLAVRVTGSTGGRLHPDVESALYRIVQEAVGNAAKHARATKVHVHLSPGSRSIRLSVRDDGCGFDPEEVGARANRGLGLLGIQERLEALRGSLRIQSQPGFGTEILVSVPLGPREETPPSRPGS